MSDESAILQEIKDGHGISAQEAARKVPGRRGSVNSSTIFRWCTAGVKMPNGARVFLGHVRVGHRIVTTEAAIARFIVESTKAYANDVAPKRTPTQRARASAKATAELIELGA